MFVIVGRLDIWQKKRTFRTWIENGNIKVMFKLNRQIMSGVEIVDQKNKVIGMQETEN